MDSLACPSPAVLDGIRSRVLRDRLLASLWGLMVSRYPRGSAVNPPPGWQELHLHGNQVIKDHPDLSSLSPHRVLGCSFRETDRTWRRWLGDILLRQLSNESFRVLQVRRIKTFGEPAVDLSQHLFCFSFLALLLPETS